MQPADEQQLLRRAREGSEDAFRLLVRRTMRQAYNIAYGWTQDHDQAEDIAQEAYVRAYGGLRSFRGEAGFATWLYRIVTNLCLTRLGQERKRAEREVRSVVETCSAETSWQGDWETRRLVEMAVRELPALQRAAVMLRHMEGMSTRQVSTILACSEGTVKTHLFRGMKKLRKKLRYLECEAAG
ncbi:MAG: sigma-70 family RNA polymerase sigma factor [Bacteroidota bacterium]